MYQKIKVIAAAHSLHDSSQIKSAFLGMTQGAADYLYRGLQLHQSMLFYTGANTLEDLLDYNERLEISRSFENKQRQQFSKFESAVQSYLGIDPNDLTYASYRSTTNLGLEVASLATGGYGAYKGIASVGRVAKIPLRGSALSNMRKFNKSGLTRTKIKNYLQNTSKLSKNEIIYDLESIGLKMKGSGSPDGRFFEFVDKNGIVRVKIHPSDQITRYNHLHIYDKKGSPLNEYLKVVNKNSTEAHIPYGFK